MMNNAAPVLITFLCVMYMFFTILSILDELGELKAQALENNVAMHHPDTGEFTFLTCEAEE